MAVKTNAITVIAALQLDNDALKIPRVGGSGFRVDQTTQFGGGPGTLSIGTTGEDIPLTDITAVGFCRVTNLEPAGGNYVTYGPKTGGTYYPFGRLDPGHSHVFQLDNNAIPGTNTFHMKANTAAVKVSIQVLDR